MASRYTILYRSGDALIKLCKIIFGRDGSYYVTCPYHPHNRASVFKAEIRFADNEQDIHFDDVLDLATLDDDDRRLKLSHHPDGLVQFSGEGVVSGLDSAGSIRGIGTFSWPLALPTAGPAFALAMTGIDEFARSPDPVGDGDVVFDADEVELFEEPVQFILEGYYLPPLWRRFLRRERGDLIVWLAHPSRAILKLKAILAPSDCDLPGGIGLELYSLPATSEEQSGFFLSGPTGGAPPR